MEINPTRTAGYILAASNNANHSHDDDEVLTFAQWCTLNGIGKRTGVRILSSGNGPIVTKLSDRRIGITRKNNRAWQASRART